MQGTFADQMLVWDRGQRASLVGPRQFFLDAVGTCCMALGPPVPVPVCSSFYLYFLLLTVVEFVRATCTTYMSCTCFQCRIFYGTYMYTF